ncbi:MAG: orotidine 5'-phosphate decarboxylase / HUMPS family protein [Thermofilum sp.]
MPSKLKKLAAEKGSRVILALDYYPPGKDPLDFWSQLLDSVDDLLAGVKLGLPALLSVGPEGLRELVESFSDSNYFIADFKLADIEDVVRTAAQRILRLGFDGVIVHLFPMCYSRLAEREAGRSLDIFGLVSMSCRSPLMDLHLEDLVDYAVKLDLAGVVVGATKPEIVKRVRELLGQRGVILSPGVGVQGAEPGSAVRAGADFEILGRSVAASPSPRQALEKIVKAYPPPRW